MEKKENLNSHALFQELENNPEALKKLAKYFDGFQPGWEKEEEPFFKKVAQLIKKNKYGLSKNKR